MVAVSAFALVASSPALAGSKLSKLDSMPPVPAASVSTDAGPCSVGDISPAALLCSGYFDGNLISNSAGNLADQVAGLASIGFAWDSSTYNEAAFKVTDLMGANPNFIPLLYGISYIGVHYGAGSFPKPKPAGGATAFYKIDAGTAGLDFVSLTRGASSNAYLYSTGTPGGGGGGLGGVPEPATWAMMIIGFGGVGAVMRRRREIVA